jgi:AcrR family transcriptional regulator
MRTYVRKYGGPVASSDDHSTAGPKHRRTWGSLGRAQIVAAALDIVRTEGLPALTIRRVAAELDASRMGLYRHVPNKQALIDLVMDAIAEHTVSTVRAPVASRAPANPSVCSLDGMWLGANSREASTTCSGGLCSRASSCACSPPSASSSRYSEAIRRSTRSSTARNGSLHMTVRCA